MFSGLQRDSNPWPRNKNCDDHIFILLLHYYRKINKIQQKNTDHAFLSSDISVREWGRKISMAHVNNLIMPIW